MNVKIPLLIALSVLLSACASNPNKIQAAYVSPLKYRDYDCDQIAMEMDYVGQRTTRLHQSLDKENKADKWQMGVGLILFWPTLFALEGGDGPEATEYAQLKGEFEALRTVSVQKRCGYGNRSFENTVTTAQKQLESETPQSTEPQATTSSVVPQETKPAVVAPATQPPAEVAARSTQSPVEKAPPKKQEAVTERAQEQTVQKPAPASSKSAAGQAQTRDTKLLNEFIGNWMLSIAIEQPGVRSFVFDEVQMDFIDADTIGAKFKNHDAKFTLQYDPEQKHHVLSYSLKRMALDKEPLLSVNRVPLTPSEEGGYVGTERIEQEKFTLNILLKVEDEEIVCDVEAQKEPAMTFEHHMRFWKKESESTANVEQQKVPVPESKPAAPAKAPVQTAAEQTPSSKQEAAAAHIPVPVTEMIGTWMGKTSQGFDITIKAEMVDGSPTVTELKYDIRLSGSSYSATTSMMLPTKISAKIVGGKFSHSGSDYKISGTFEGGELNGDLSASNVHPQGYGTATADVTFELKSIDASGEDAQSAEDQNIAENTTLIKGVFVDETTGRPLRITPSLWITFPKGLTKEEEADLSARFNAQEVKKETDSSGVFSIEITDPVPGNYGLLTMELGIISPDFEVSPGEIIDLGTIKVKSK